MSRMNVKISVWFAAFAALALVHAQDRLKTMPGYDQHEKVAGQIAGSVKSGALAVTWKDDTTFEYNRDGKLWRYDVAAKKATEAGEAGGEPRGRGKPLTGIATSGSAVWKACLLYTSRCV